MPDIETGIYKHYKEGKLYFVEKTFPFKQSGKEDVLSVYYYPLYEKSAGYARSIADFNEMVHTNTTREAKIGEDEILGADVEGKFVKRFELIRALNHTYLRMFLPGSRVVLTDFLGFVDTVSRCEFNTDSSISVFLSYGGNHFFKRHIESFLSQYVPYANTQ